MVTVAAGWVSGAGGGVTNDSDLETVLEQVPQVRFHAHIRQHATQNDFGDCAFAELQYEIIGLGAPYLMRTGNDRFPVLDIGFEFFEPVGAGAGESF